MAVVAQRRSPQIAGVELVRDAVLHVLLPGGVGEVVAADDDVGDHWAVVRYAIDGAGAVAVLKLRNQTSGGADIFRTLTARASEAYNRDYLLPSGCGAGFFRREIVLGRLPPQDFGS